MNYKPSRFNYHTENRHGELIVYNSFTGSLVKVMSFDKEHAKNLLYSNFETDDDSIGDCIKELIVRGYLIPEEEYEDIKVNRLEQLADGDNRLQLIILPTEQCNFRCVYCYEDFIRGKMSIELQNAIISYVKKNINNYTGLHVSWFGGEPLMAKDVIKYLSEGFIDICKRAKKPYTASMTTNAYLLDAETLMEMVRYKVLTYQVTIDGLEKTHDKQKPLANGGKSFSKVINNLVEIKNTVKTGVFKITIRTNVTKEIYETLDEYIDFFYNIFSEDERFEFFLRPAGDYGGEAVHNTDVQSILIDTNDFGKVYEKFIDADKKLRFHLYRTFLNPCGSICYAAQKNVYVIDSVGNIRKCTCHLDSDKDNKVGELKPDATIHLDQYQLARWTVNRSSEQKCKECFFLPSCFNRACPMKRINNRDNVICSNEKENINKTIELLDACGHIDII